MRFRLHGLWACFPIVLIAFSGCIRSQATGGTPEVRAASVIEDPNDQIAALISIAENRIALKNSGNEADMTPDIGVEVKLKAFRDGTQKKKGDDDAAIEPVVESGENIEALDPKKRFEVESKNPTYFTEPIDLGLDLVDKIGDSGCKVNLLSRLAMVLVRTDRKEEANQIVDKCKTVFSSVNSLEERTEGITQLTLVLAKGLADKEQALQFIKETEESAAKETNTSKQATALVYVAKSYRLAGDDDSARKSMETIARAIESQPDMNARWDLMENTMKVMEAERMYSFYDALLAAAKKIADGSEANHKVLRLIQVGHWYVDSGNKPYARDPIYKEVESAWKGLGEPKEVLPDINDFVDKLDENLR